MVVKCQVAITESKLSYIKSKFLFEQFFGHFLFYHCHPIKKFLFVSIIHHLDNLKCQTC